MVSACGYNRKDGADPGLDATNRVATAPHTTLLAAIATPSATSQLQILNLSIGSKAKGQTLRRQRPPVHATPTALSNRLISVAVGVISPLHGLVNATAQHRFLRHAQLAFPNDALVRLGRMFDPVMKLAAGSWKPPRHHVSSRSWIDCSTSGGTKLHVVTDREPMGHC